MILAIARDQHGVVARAQLLAAGVSRHQVAQRLRTGVLTELYRGVYLVGAAGSEHAHEMAALLACGPGAVLSHRSAIAHWELLPYAAGHRVHVTVPRPRFPRPPGIAVHRAPIESGDIRRRGALLISSPPRAIFEVASILDPETLERVVADAMYRGLAREAELRDQLRRNAGKRGAGRLRRVLYGQGGPRRTRSSGERALLRALRDAGYDDYEVNATIHGHEVDFLWRKELVALELDGWEAHSHRLAFERDRLKAAELQSHGVTVVRVTGRQLRDDFQGVLDRLLRTLARSRQRGNG